MKNSSRQKQSSTLQGDLEIRIKAHQMVAVLEDAGFDETDAKAVTLDLLLCSHGVKPSFKAEPEPEPEPEPETTEDEDEEEPETTGATKRVRRVKRRASPDFSMFGGKPPQLEPRGER